MSEYKKVLESVEDNKKVLELMEKYRMVLLDIVNDFPEESFDKIKQQRNDHIRWAKEALGSASENLEGTRA